MSRIKIVCVESVRLKDGEKWRKQENIIEQEKMETNSQQKSVGF
jgi:hypothetical protein